MDKLQDAINKASHVLLDAEVRLRTYAIQISQIDKEIALLNAIEANLEENVRMLKRRRVTVVATEYRKVKRDLGLAQTKKSFLRVDRENALKYHQLATDWYNKAKAEYQMVYDRLHNPPNNVIEVQFGSKDGKQK